MEEGIIIKIRRILAKRVVAFVVAIFAMLGTYEVLGAERHINLEKASRDRIVRQLEKMEKRLVECIGQDYELNTVRFPFGAGRHKGTKSSFAKAVRDAGYMHARFWNIDTTDANEILRKTKNGSIILLHSNNKDMRAFKKILPVFQEKGFEMVTVSELLGLTKTSPLPLND